MKLVARDIARARICSGERVIVTYPDPPRKNPDTEYHLDSGGAISAATFRALLPELEPTDLGLIYDAPQSYRMKGAAYA